MNFEKEIIELRLDEIIPNRFQPREIFDETELQELAESIKNHGVINPVIVRKVGDKYEMVAGERRHKASMLAGKATIPAIVANLDDFQSAEIALIENVQRKDLTPIEEAKTYETILRMGHLTQEDLAQKVGKAQPTIANKLRLLDLDPRVQTALLEGKISERHARALLKLESKDRQNALLEEVINNRLTVRELDLKIMDLTNGSETVIEKTTPELISEADLIDTPVIFGFDKEVSTPVDINPEEPSADIDRLLKQDPLMPNVQIPQEETFPQEEAPNRFIPQSESPTTITKAQYEKQPVVESEPLEQEIIPPVTPPPAIEPDLPLPVTLTKEPGGKDLRTAINTIRQCISTIEQFGFAVDSEEFDFEQMYQVIIKINKN